MLIKTATVNRLILGSAALAALDERPTSVVEGGLGKATFQARIGIPGYAEKVTRHYADIAPGGLAPICDQASIVPPFQHFGLICEFDNPTELRIHETDLSLDEHLRELVQRFGSIVIRNAYLPENDRRADQDNIFPHL